MKTSTDTQTICNETTPDMPQAERDIINRANTLPNREQRSAAHSSALRRTNATAAERRAHEATCDACAVWMR